MVCLKLDLSKQNVEKQIFSLLYLDVTLDGAMSIHQLISPFLRTSSFSHSNNTTTSR